MEPFRHHVFICSQVRLEDKGYCTDRGSESVLGELRRLVHRHNLDDQVQVTPCGCLGLCQQGPNLVVYPEGIWYSGITPDQLREIVQSHFVEGKPVTRLMHRDPEQMHLEILKANERTHREEAAREEAGVLPAWLRRLADDFRASRAFLTAVELDVFSTIGEGATSAEVAEHVSADPRATETLLNGLTSLGLLVKQGEVFKNGPDTGRYLRRGLPDDGRAALMHRVHMWDRWSTLTECIREGTAMGLQADAPFSHQAYVAATHKIATLAAPGLVSALGLPEVKRVLDIGGGSGAYTMALLRAFPNATAEMLDLQPVIKSAARFIREAGLEHRVRLRAGDFIADDLGSGFDLVLLSYVVHLNTADTAKRLLRKAFDALVPGGRVVINDFILNSDKTLPRSAALHALHLLVATRGGTIYSEPEFHDMLRGAGFGDVERIPLTGPTDVIVARKG